MEEFYFMYCEVVQIKHPKSYNKECLLSRAEVIFEKTKHKIEVFRQTGTRVEHIKTFS
jgi:hypothetical protein